MVLQNEEKEEFEIEDAEVFLEELTPATNYELSVGLACGATIIWSKPIQFSTTEEEEK